VLEYTRSEKSKVKNLTSEEEGRGRDTTSSAGKVGTAILVDTPMEGSHSEEKSGKPLKKKRLENYTKEELDKVLKNKQLR